MTLDIPSDVHLALERRMVLDDLGLAMLFVDCGPLHLDAAPDGARPPEGSRVLRAHVTPRARTSPVETAAMLCRVLHDLRVPGVELARVAGGVLLRFRYPLPTGTWTVELRVPSAPPAGRRLASADA